MHKESPDDTQRMLEDIIRQLRVRARGLQQEKRDLQAEFDALQEEVELLRKGVETRRVPDLVQAGVVTEASMAPPVTGFESGDWRPPTFPGEGASSKAPQSLGRGMAPELARQLGVTPERPGERPALDLGYVNTVGADALDELPYGLIVVDVAGDVVLYNETEARLAGFSKERVVGKNFFSEVAPCTQVKEFQGRFEDFVAGKLGRVTFFDFAFHFERGTQNVVIGLSHGRVPGLFNFMLLRQ